jgi:hypothetical protein
VNIVKSHENNQPVMNSKIQVAGRVEELNHSVKK